MLLSIRLWGTRGQCAIAATLHASSQARVCGNASVGDGILKGHFQWSFRIRTTTQPNEKAACTHVDVWALHTLRVQTIHNHVHAELACTPCATMPRDILCCTIVYLRHATSQHLHLSTASTAVSRRCQQAAPATPPAVLPAVQTSCPDATRTNTRDVYRTSSTAVSIAIVLSDRPHDCQDARAGALLGAGAS